VIGSDSRCVIRRGVHRSVQALERDIRTWLADWNEHPMPFVWTKTADEILDKVAAYCQPIVNHWRKSIITLIMSLRLSGLALSNATYEMLKMRRVGSISGPFWKRWPPSGE
jgi:hypothetical protein